MALKIISFFCSLTDATTSVRTSPGCLSEGTLWESWTGPTKPDGSWRARQPHLSLGIRRDRRQEAIRQAGGGKLAPCLETPVPDERRLKRHQERVIAQPGVFKNGAHRAWRQPAKQEAPTPQVARQRADAMNGWTGPRKNDKSEESPPPRRRGCPASEDESESMIFPHGSDRSPSAHTATEGSM